MKRSGNIAIVSILIGFGLLLSAQTQVKEIKREQLRSAVEKTVAEQNNGLTIHGFSTEVDKGKKN